MVQMQMEYRAMDDVLSGSVPSDAPLDARHHEELDADTFVEWASGDTGDRRLVSFRMLHARTRANDDLGFDRLPEPIRRGALEFFRSWSMPDVMESPAGPDHDDALDTGALAMPLLQLSLDERPAVRGDRLDAEMVGDELRRLAKVMIDLPGTPDEDRVTRFVYAVSELATALEFSDGLAAPGATAAVRAAVRGGVPLTSGERVLLVKLLDDLDDPTVWNDVARRLESFVNQLDPGATITE